MSSQYIKKAVACIIEKDLFNNDRECLVKDPTANVLEISAVIDRNSKIGIRTEKLGLKWCRIQITDQKYEDVYEYKYKSIKYSDSCPPAPLQTICRLMLEHDLQDQFVAFCYCCERLAQKYEDVAAAHAADAAAHAANAAHAADAAADVAAADAANAAHAANAAAHAAANAAHAADAAAVYAAANAAAHAAANAAHAAHAANAAAHAAAVYAAANAAAHAAAVYAAANAAAHAAANAAHAAANYAAADAYEKISQFLSLILKNTPVGGFLI